MTPLTHRRINDGSSRGATRHPPPRGLTYFEVIFSVGFVLAGLVSLLGVFLSYERLNEHARNLSWAMNDAARVMEELRQRNSGANCVAPDLGAPAGSASWDQWLQNAGGGKTLQLGTNAPELIWVSPDTADNHETVTVSVCWRHRNRVLGECAWDGAQLVASPGGDGMVSSPVMLSTRMTCRP